MKPGKSLALTIIEFYFLPEERPDVMQELSRAEVLLDSLVKTPLTLQQRQALVCMLADVAGGHVTGVNFASSEMIRAINARYMHVAASQFVCWTKVKGEIDERAWLKRLCEQTLFLRGALSLK